MRNSIWLLVLLVVGCCWSLLVVVVLVVVVVVAVAVAVAVAVVVVVVAVAFVWSFCEIHVLSEGNLSLPDNSGI